MKKPRAIALAVQRKFGNARRPIGTNAAYEK
jgi:hypothetical protein